VPSNIGYASGFKKALVGLKNVAHPAKNNEGQAHRSVHVTLPLNSSLALLLTTHLDTMADKEVLW
jgi:hypothetical protein